MATPLEGVIPVLPVPDVDAALGYYRDVLGFSVEGRHQNESGEVVFGSVLCGQVNFYLSKTSERFTPTCCYVFSEEVDELCQYLESRGARIVEQPDDKPWGYRQFTLEDLNGHTFHVFRFSDGVE